MRERITAFIVLLSAFGVRASADVARSATGTGISEAAAVQDAKNEASRHYKVKSWGRQDCSKEIPPKNPYDVPNNRYDKPPEPYYRCTVEFTTGD